MIGLHVQPACGTATQGSGQPQGHVRADGGTAIQYAGKGGAGDADAGGKIGDANVGASKYAVAQDFAGVGWVVQGVHGGLFFGNDFLIGLEIRNPRHLRFPMLECKLLGRWP